MLQFNQFGLPLVGADICGFSGLTNPEMCIRWHQLGAFYPFSRNHNAAGMLAQDPASLGGEAAAAIREVLLLRYYLLPHLYTLFALQTLTGGTVARPVWHEFPREVPALGLDSHATAKTSITCSIRGRHSNIVSLTTTGVRPKAE